MFPLFSDNTILTLGLKDLSKNIPICANSKFLRKVLTCELINMYRHFGRPYLTLSSGTSTLMFRAKKNNCRVRAVQELYYLTLNMNAVCSSETSAKVHQLTGVLFLKLTSESCLLLLVIITIIIINMTLFCVCPQERSIDHSQTSLFLESAG